MAAFVVILICLTGWYVQLDNNTMPDQLDIPETDGAIDVESMPDTGIDSEISLHTQSVTITRPDMMIYTGRGTITMALSLTTVCVQTSKGVLTWRSSVGTPVRSASKNTILLQTNKDFK